MLRGIGSLLGPLLSGAMMTGNPQGLPLALCLTAGIFALASLNALRLSRRALSR